MIENKEDAMAWTILVVTIVYAVAMFTIPLSLILSLLLVWGAVGFLLGVGCLWAIGVLSGSV